MTQLANFILLLPIFLTRVFFRGVAVLLLFAFLASKFAWPSIIYDQVPLLNQAELRVLGGEPQDAQLDGVKLQQRVVIIENRGRKPASDVIVNIYVSPSRIARFQVFSDYPAQVAPETALAQGTLILRIDTLAPGAQTVVYLWAAKSSYDPDSTLIVRAVHTDGSSKEWQVKSGLEEAQDYGSKVYDALGRSSDFAQVVLLSRDQRDNFFSAPNPLAIIPNYVWVTVIVLLVIIWLFFGWWAVISVLTSAVLTGLIFTWVEDKDVLLTSSLLLWAGVFIVLALVVNKLRFWIL